MIRPFLTTAVAVMALSGALAGCRIIPETIPSDIYRLTPPVASEQGVAREYGAPTIMIALPGANRTLGGNSIMIAKPDGSMAIAAGARWASPARSLVQDVIVETFEIAAPSLAPLRPGDGIPGNFDLSIDMRHFEAEYDMGMEAAPLVRVSLGARLISDARELHGSTVLSADVRASNNTMGAIVAAFNAATAQVAADMAYWTVEHADLARARQAEAAAARRSQ